MRRRTTYGLVFLAFLVWPGGLALASAANAAPVVPPNFTDTQVTKVSGPTAVTFTPDARMLITGKSGTLYVFQNGVNTTALDLTGRVCSDKERALGGVVADPAFAGNHYIYLYYNFKKFGNCDYNSATGPVNRLSRFVLPDNNIVDPASETVLIDNIPSPDGIHNAGDLHFGKDGYLYVTVGDGGCDYAGDSGCGSSNDAARDPNVLLGKVLRITSAGGIPPTNPYQGTDSARCNLAGRTAVGKRCQETFASGLRNPWRSAFDPNASGTRFFVNDVGNNTWEEVNLGQAGADYGWNIREGHCVRNSDTNCPPPPAGLTDPIYDYNHSTGCTSITGGAFVPNGIWPVAYDNTYLYGDFVCGKIIRLTPVTGGGFTATDFATGLGTSSITSMQFGPYGSTQALYYLNFLNGGEVRRIAFTGTANRAPTAVASAGPTSGPAPLTVNFDGRASSDPDGDTLSYDWDFGDGTAHGTSAQVSHTYTAPGTYTTTLRVRDGRGGEGTDTIRIDAGNDPPTPTIISPSTTERFSVDEVMRLRGSATDPQDGPLPDSALSWTVIKHHNTHMHPFLDPTTGNDIPITGPNPEDLAATTTTYLEISLTATDSQGVKTTVTRNVLPQLVDLTFQTSPTGLQLEVAGSTITAPRTVTSWDAWTFPVKALEQVDGTGQTYAFSSWSDGGGASHMITTPPAPATYSAVFRPSATPIFSDGFESGDLSKWSSVIGLTVQQQEVYGGSWAARQTSTGSATYAYKQLSVAQNDLYYGMRFKVLSQGANNVTLGKFSTAAGASRLAFYRSTSGILGLRNDAAGLTTTSNTSVSLGAWHQLVVHIHIDGSAGETDVSFDGAPVDALKTTQSLGTDPIGRIQVGNNQTARTYDVAFDDIAVTRPVGDYTRPVGATPVRTALVPAFTPCGAPAANGSHGGALSGASCAPPVPRSSLVAVGAGSVGFANLTVLPAGQCASFDSTHCYPDVTIRADVTDVRSGSPSGGDYDTPQAQDLTLVMTLPDAGLSPGQGLRITDRYNALGSSTTYDRAATVAPVAFPTPVRCTPTADTTTGSTCDAQTTANTLVPGAVISGNRAIWEVGQFELLDQGANATPGDGDDRVFEAEGVFVP